MIAKADAEQSLRLLEIGELWFLRGIEAYERGDKRSMRVVAMAHGMTLAAHEALQKRAAEND